MVLGVGSLLEGSQVASSPIMQTEGMAGISEHVIVERYSCV